MQLRLSVTHPFEQVLEVEVPNVTVEALVDCTRASCADGVVTIDHTFDRQNVVPDVDRYRLRRNDNRFALCCHPVRAVSPDSNHYCDVPPGHPNRDYSKTLVIVLESPHKDEFRCNVGQPIAPAQGQTGSGIEKFLDCMLHSCDALYGDLEEDTRVVLVNPVQFQTSLVAVVKCSNWSKVRTAVWRALWNHRPAVTHQNYEGQTTDALYPIRSNFMERLVELRPDYVVNACTLELKPCIRSFLERCFGDLDRYEGDHPSSWNSSKRLRPVVALDCA